MKRFIVPIVLVLAMVATTLTVSAENIWECPNWGFFPTVPSDNPNDPSHCVFRGETTVGTVPDGWFADTERGPVGAGESFAASQVTLRPTDKSVTGVVASSPQPVVETTTTSPSQPSTADSSGCLVFNGVQTDRLPDGGCWYVGPGTPPGMTVPNGWLANSGTPAVMKKPGTVIATGTTVITFYPI